MKTRKFLVAYMHRTGHGSCVVTTNEIDYMTEDWIARTSKMIASEHSLESVGITVVTPLRNPDAPEFP